MEPDQTVAVRLHGFDRCCQQAVAKGQFDAFAGLAARTGQAFPQAIPLVGEQQHLDRRCFADCMAHQASRDDARIVEHHAVARLHIVEQIAEMAVRHRTVRPIEYHQARGVTLRKRMLRDQPFGQIKVKITFFHCIKHGRSRGAPMPFSSFVVCLRSAGDLDAGEVEFQNILIIKALLRHAIGTPLAHADAVAPARSGKGIAGCIGNLLGRLLRILR